MRRIAQLGLVRSFKATIFPEGEERTRGGFRRLLRVARPEAALLGGAFVGLVFSSGSSLALPKAFGFLVDTATGKAVEGWEPVHIATACFGVFVVGAGATFAQTALLKVAGERVMRRLRVQLFGSILRQPIAFHDANPPGQLVSRLSTDTYMTANAVSDNVSVGVRRAFDAAGALGLMLWLSPSLTLASVGVMPVFFLSAFFGRWAKKQTRMQLNRLSESSEIAEERLVGIRTVRAFSTEEVEESKYLNKLNELYHTAIRLAYGTAAIYGGTTLALNTAFLVVLFRGTHLVEAGSMTVGELTSFLLYSGYLGFAMSGLLKAFMELMKGVGSSSRVLEMIELPPAIPRRPDVLSTVPLEGDIVFEDVCFAYPDRPQAQILRGLNLTVAASQSLAIVGGSGAGKSTITNLLMRFHKPTSGTIKVGGKLLDDIPHHYWMSRIGLVSQDAMMFTGSILDNLRLANPGATIDEIVAACVAANADAFIREFPLGYDTPVGGTSLSGGQRQRLSIARTLLHSPDLLLLDEPTSALDWKSENLVREGLQKAMEGRTTVIIAHRASTIRHVNRIAVLKYDCAAFVLVRSVCVCVLTFSGREGRIDAIGTHEELMALPRGFYKKLIASNGIL